MSTSDEPSSRKHDRKALTLFLGILLALSLAFDIPMARSSSIGIWNGWAVLLLMWAPGIAAVVTSAVVYRSLQPLGLLGNRKVFSWVSLCIALPVLYTLLIYPTLQAWGLLTTSVTGFSAGFVFLGFWLSLKSALGEELGWRGFAAPIFSRLYGFKSGQLYLGIIWYIYHVPALLFTEYGASAHAVFGNAMFFVTMVALSYFLGWARQESDSVWPSAVFHASHNLFFLHLFQPVIQTSDLSGWLVGEQGLAIALVQTALGVVALYFYRKKHNSIS